MKLQGATKPLAKAYAKLHAERNAASQAIYDAALPRKDIRWTDCYRDCADDAARKRYDDADRALRTFQRRMVFGEKRGYFSGDSSNPAFFWYRP